MDDLNARLLIITRNLPPLTGGMERLTQQLIGTLASHYQVVVIGPPGCAPYLPATVEVHACRGSGAAAFLIEASLRTLWLCARPRSFATIIASSGLTAPLAWLASKLQGGDYLTIVHGLDLVTPHALYRQLFLPAVRGARTVVANSANTARLAREVGVDGARLTVVHPGVEWPVQLPAASAFRQRHGLAARPLMLAVGRLVARKGLPEFVRHALPAIVRAVPDALLVVIGDEPRQAIRREAAVLPRLEAAIEAQGLSQHVLLCGHADDAEVREACVAASVFVFPLIAVAGDVEGFGMVAAEAAACGLRSVAFDEGGVADALVPGVTGTLVARGDYAALADSIIAELRDEQHDAHRVACREAARGFQWSHYDERMRAVLAAHLSGQRAP